MACNKCGHTKSSPCACQDHGLTTPCSYSDCTREASTETCEDIQCAECVSYCQETFSVTQGKWYMEAKKTTNANGTSNGQGAVAVGFAELQSNLGNDNPQNDSDVYSSILVINDNGWTTNFANGTQWSTPLAVNDGDIVGIALDLDGNNYTFYVNGSQVDTGSLGGSYDGNGLTPCVINYGGDTREFTCNFGSPSFSISSGNADANGHGSFEYSVPSNYFALCTKNLAEFG